MYCSYRLGEQAPHLSYQHLPLSFIFFLYLEKGKEEWKGGRGSLEERRIVGSSRRLSVHHIHSSPPLLSSFSLSSNPESERRDSRGGNWHVIRPEKRHLVYYLWSAGRSWARILAQDPEFYWGSNPIQLSNTDVSLPTMPLHPCSASLPCHYVHPTTS